jgi:hypothetical protein
MAAARRRSALTWLASLAALVLLPLPAVVAFGAGWMELGWRTDRMGGLGAVVDENPVEAWVLLALAFLVWVPAVMVALVVVLDRLGYHYMPHERKRRPTRRERRRQRTTLRFLAGQQRPGDEQPGGHEQPRRRRRAGGE